MNKLLWIVLSIGLSTQLLSATPALPLTSGKAVNDSVKLKEKKYYSITVPKNKSVRVNLTELEADVDLYIKKGNEVRVRFNDCYSSNSNRENEECIVTNEGETSIYTILVNGFKGSSFTLKATVEGAEEIPTLTSDAIEDAVERKEGKQYKIDAEKGETIAVTLFNLTADADLRVRVGRKAGLSSFDCKSTNGGTKTDECTITLEKDATVYVQVYGYRAANYSIKKDTVNNSENQALINKAKKQCIEKSKSISEILCTLDNKAYIIDNTKLFTTTLHIVDFDLETIGESIASINKPSPNSTYVGFRILKDTELIAIDKIYNNGDLHDVTNFYNLQGKLQFHTKTYQDVESAMFLRGTIKTIENGNKLRITYKAFEPVGNDRDKWWVTYEDIYDISNINNTKKINNRKI